MNCYVSVIIIIVLGLLILIQTKPVEGYNPVGYEVNVQSNFPPYNPYNIELLPFKQSWTGRNYISDRTSAPILTDPYGPYPQQACFKPWLIDHPHKTVMNNNMISGYDPKSSTPLGQAGDNYVSSDYTRLAQWLGDEYVYPRTGWIPWEK